MPESSAIVGDDSAVFRIFLSYILGCHFSWQTQYLVRLQGDSCCAAHCEWRFSSFPKISLVFWSIIFWGQAQYLEMLGHSCCSAHCEWRFGCLKISLIFWIILECNFSWQGQYLVMSEGDSCCSHTVNNVSSLFPKIPHILECYLSWQAYYLVTLQGGSCWSAHCKSHFSCLHTKSLFFEMQLFCSAHCTWHFTSFQNKNTSLIFWRVILWQGRYLMLEGDSCCCARRKLFLSHFGVLLFVAGSIFNDVLSTV